MAHNRPTMVFWRKQQEALGIRKLRRRLKPIKRFETQLQWFKTTDDVLLSMFSWRHSRREGLGLFHVVGIGYGEIGWRGEDLAGHAWWVLQREMAAKLLCRRVCRVDKRVSR